MFILNHGLICLDSGDVTIDYALWDQMTLTRARNNSDIIEYNSFDIDFDLTNDSSGRILETFT